MRFKQEEKMEIIRIVEQSELGVKRTLESLGVSRSTFYSWDNRYREEPILPYFADNKDALFHYSSK